MKKGLISLFVAAIVLAAGMFYAPQAAELKTFTITSGPLGGDFYALGGVIGEAARSVMPGATVSVNTGGSVENLLKIDAGKADLGTSMIKLYEESLKAEGVFANRKPVQNVKIMMYVAPMPMSFFLVRADSPYTSIAEIARSKPKIRLLTSKKGSSPAVASENMLSQYGFTFDDIKNWGGSVSYVSYAEASSLIQDGHADAYVGPIVSSINELITTVKMKMLPIDQAVLDKLSSDGYMTFTLKAGQYYFVDKDVQHMAETVVLPVGSNLPDDAVYALTKVLCEKPDMIRNVHQTYSVFEPSKSAEHINVQYIHPGAGRYYKEKGWVK